MSKHKLIYLEWEDAMSNNEGWKDLEDSIEWAEDNRYIVRQAGWLIKETKNYICLALGYTPAENGYIAQYKLFIKIPKTWIRKRIDLTKHINK